MQVVLILLIVLGVITLVGHGIWVVLAWLVRLGQSDTSAQQPADGSTARRRCPRCGHGFLSQARPCGVCGLDARGPIATELEALGVTVQQLHRLVETGNLDTATLQRLEQSIEARRQALGDARRASAPVPAARPLLPLWQQLEQQLEACPDARTLAEGERRRILVLHGQVTEARLESLSAKAQLALARLLGSVGRAEEALRAYRRFLSRYPQEFGFGAVALEAGRFAAVEKQSAQALWFLDQALARTLPAEDRAEAERLVQALRPPVEAVPEVIPFADEATPVAPASSQQAAAEAPVLARPALRPGSRHPAPKPRLAERPPQPPRPPRRSLAEVLAAFMEERNIFWGELIGGLLMVGCSIALVIYLWKDLERIPYFQFLIFVCTTAALFGAGFYTLHRLKLTTTGRGLLAIATLLVPLDFLVMAGLAGQRADAGTLDVVFRLGTEALSLAIFAGLMHFAVRALVTDGRGLLIVAILIASVSQLAAPRLLADREHVALLPFLLLGAVPVLGAGVTSAGLLFRLGRQKALAEREAIDVFAFVGLATFALAVALGFLTYWSSAAGTMLAMQRLAVFVSLAGMPVLLGGLVVHRGLAQTADASGSADAKAAALRTAGTAVAAAGVAVLLLAVLLAWPQPLAMFLVCAVDFAVLTVIAFAWGLPLAHAAALPCLAVGYLTAFHLIAGRLDVPAEQLTARTLALAISAESGAALVVLVVLLGAAAEFLARVGRSLHGRAYAAGAGLVALASLVLVNARGLESPGHAALVTGVYAVLGLGMNLRWQRPQINYLALALAAGSTLWGLAWYTGTLTPSWGTVLASEAAILAGAAVAGRGALPRACRDMAAAFALLALGLTLASAAPSPVHTYTGAFLALAAFLLAEAYGAVALTWVGSAFVLATLLNALVQPAGPLALRQAVPLACLSHATLALLTGLLLRRTTAARLFGVPLCATAFVSSVLVPPALLGLWGEMTLLAGYTTWLAAVWLVVAWSERWPVQFTAFQAALSAGVLFAVSAWLQQRGWEIRDPCSMQAYGFALGVLAIAWLAARLGLRGHAVGRLLLEPNLPALDEVVLGLLVLGQLGLACWGIVPGVLRELTPVGTAVDLASWPISYAHAYGPGAWAVLGVLAVALGVGLWGRQQAAAVFGLILLAVTVPVLTAGPFEAELATASALRWGLGLGLVACAIPLWGRDELVRLAVRLHCAPASAAWIAAPTRHLLIAVTVFPVLILTGVVALMIGFDGQFPAGPLTGSFFARLGCVPANITPLALVSAGLVGFALRERSAGYAFSAGLVVMGSVMGGYALGVVTSGGTLDAAHGARTLQLGTVAAALWALAWLASRPFVEAWRERPDAPLAAQLMSVQLGLAAAGNILLLVPALLLLVVLSPEVSPWTVRVGMPLGWLALILTVAARGWRVPPATVPPSAARYDLGLFGLAFLGLLACSVTGWRPEWGHRTLLLGWAAYAPILALAGWAFAERAPRESSTALHRSLGAALAAGPVAFWVGITGVLVVFLGIKTAVVDQDPLWAAGAIALACPAGAALAVWRRREGWAFTAGLGVNLATSLVVWHFHHDASHFEEWWAYLIQANAVATACVAFLWLAVLRRIYDARALSLATSPLLATQIALGLAANFLLLAGPLAQMVGLPGESLPAALVPIGQAGGWLALLLPAAAALWYADQAEPRARGHLLVAGGLGLGILAACSAASGAPPDDWLAYHVLTATWAGLGLAVLAAEWVAPLETGEVGQFSPFPALARWLTLPTPLLRAWLNVLGLLVLSLALRGTWQDPARPYWSGGAIGAVSAMAGALALRMRSPAYVYVSALLMNLAGMIAWVAWDGTSVMNFGYVHVLAFAIAAGLWTGLTWLLEGRVALPELHGLPAPAHVLAIFGLCVLALLVAAGLGADLAGGVLNEDLHLAWLALAVLVAAMAGTLWDRHARFALGGLYAAGLLAIGLGVHALELVPREVAWPAAPALAGYVLLTAALSWAAPRLPTVWGRLALPERPLSWPEAWFAPAQFGAGLLALALTVWIVLAFDDPILRLAGPLSVALLIPAGILLAQETPGRWGADLRYVTLVLGCFACIEAGWAFLAPAAPGLWLYRSVLLLAALALMAGLYGVGLPRILPPPSAWGVCGRRLGPVLGMLAVAVLLGVLIQEAFLYDDVARQTPMAGPAIAAVAAALVGLTALALTFAVVPGRDPFRLSERGRTLYVYAAEGLLVLLAVHLRMTAPFLFHGFFARYWTFAAMGLAFTGVGLSEWFSRRGLPVLAEPLRRTGIFLPLLPLLAFWARPPEAVPLLPAPEHFGRYAVLWFLAGGLYTVVALSQRSFRLAFCAALAANAGLWSLLYQHQLGFLVHPQLWLIPPALVLLVAEHMNRDRLSEAQGNALRYAGLLLVYVSSTADMFLAGLGNSVVLPLVLALLCVAGVLAGMLLRVRAFLYLGVSFLLLVVVSMILHAAVGLHQGWVWWASGIVLGAAIIALFAVFEKRRNDVLRVLDQLKKWD